MAEYPEGRATSKRVVSQPIRRAAERFLSTLGWVLNWLGLFIRSNALVPENLPYPPGAQFFSEPTPLTSFRPLSLSMSSGRVFLLPPSVVRFVPQSLVVAFTAERVGGPHRSPGTPRTEIESL